MRAIAWCSIGWLMLGAACEVHVRGAGAKDDAGATSADDAGPGVRDANAELTDASSTVDAGPERQDGGRNDAGSSSGTDAGSSSAVWRPYNATSPWNTLVPDNPPLAPDSAALIADLRTSSQFGQNLDINLAEFSVPLYFATASTPTVEVLCDLGGAGFAGNDGEDARAQIPIPAAAAPDPELDGHISIVDRARNLEWGMYQAVNNNGKWTCTLGASSDLAGDGLKPYKPDNDMWWTSHGPRACGFSMVAGLIRTEEIDAGRIDHALVIAYPHIRAGFYMSPASTAQTRIGNESIQTRGIPCGGRIQLDPKLDLDSLKLTRAGRIVAEALQRYGAYVGDYSGAISIYAENSSAAQAHWKGVLSTYEFASKLDLTKFRALQFGKLTDDGNGD